jgi:hypothetical protein
MNGHQALQRRSRSLENDLQTFDRGHPTSDPLSWLEWVARSQLGNFSTSPLYEVSRMRSALQQRFAIASSQTGRAIATALAILPTPGDRTNLPPQLKSHRRHHSSLDRSRRR